MKRPRGGSLFLVLTPDELVARLATLVPPPRAHAMRYHGLFAPHCKDRGRVVPAGPGRGHRHGVGSAGPEVPPAAPVRVPDQEPPPSTPAVPSALGRPGAPLTNPTPPPGRVGPRTRVPWADLLRKVFAVDVLECPGRGGRLEVLAFITEQAVARKILDHLGLASQAPPLAPARPTGGEPDVEGSAVLDLKDALPLGVRPVLNQSPECTLSDPGRRVECLTRSRIEAWRTRGQVIPLGKGAYGAAPATRKRRRWVR